jgi:hypothetical protein
VGPFLLPSNNQESKLNSHLDSKRIDKSTATSQKTEAAVSSTNDGILATAIRPVRIVPAAMH